MPGIGRYLAGVLAAGAGGILLYSPSLLFAEPKEDGPEFATKVPSRMQQLARMRESSREKPFDLLIIGGGATGAGCAADAATRGIKTALVERDDFGSGTSSKSTKLVHGGVRYLEKAVFNLDYSQLKLVWEALHERLSFLRNVPHLAAPLPILMPCYNWYDVPYFWAGLKAYDFVAGSTGLIMSKYMNFAESVNHLPTLAQRNPVNGKTLKGSILYYDGQFNDARVNVTLACTAAAAGAALANHLECMNLLKNNDGSIIGAHCRDVLTGDEVDVYAKVVINATGTLADSVRKQSNPEARTSVLGAAGTHVTLPTYYGSSSMGLIIPKTKDGRVLFMLPWQGQLIAGTTDIKSDVNPKSQATEAEVTFILESLSDFLGVQVKRSDVLSAWSGVRPLPCNPNAKNTESIVRDHLIFTDEDGMVTVTGGKWTTYRLMAQEAVDAAVATGRLPLNVGKCRTANMPLLGAREYKPTLHAEISQKYSHINAQPTGSAPADPPSSPSTPLEVDSAMAQHLAKSYGDRAHLVLDIAEQKGLGARLAPQHPIIEAEVAYCVENEYCETVEDFLERRTRLAFIDANAAVSSIPRVAEIMGNQLGWSQERKLKEIEQGKAALQRSFFTK